MLAARPILVIASTDLRLELSERLAADNFIVVDAPYLPTADDFLGADAERIDLMIVDFDLPDLDGNAFCAALRAGGVATPIIAVGEANEETIVEALNAGADDFIRMPLRLEETVARVRALLRMSDLSEQASFSIGPFSFRPGQRTLTDAKKRRIRLTTKEVDILKFFYRRPNVEVSRSTLMNEVWGYNAGTESHTLETHVYRLRQKIEPDPSNHRLLVTVGGGYLLRLGG